MIIQLSSHLHHQPTPQGGVVILDANTGRWHALNGTAGLLWQSWNDGAGFEHSVATLALHHPSTPVERLRSDAAELLGALMRRGLVRTDVAATTGAVPMASDPPAAPPRLLGLIAFPVLLVAVGLSRMPFRFTHAFVRLLRHCHRGQASADATRTIVNAVDRVAAYYPGRVACMEKSLAAVLLSALRGRRVDLCLGAVPDPYRFHAWVEASGMPVSATGEQALPYLRVLTV
jgi:hypothetical protein